MSRTNISFLSLLKEEGLIKIPQIQRDYAQGRDNEIVHRIRMDFLKSLLQIVYGEQDFLRLDFVYGYVSTDGKNTDVKISSFDPLDGQQRLTTLFLLHWVFAPKGCTDLQSEIGTSRFIYATRKTSEDFCDELVKRNAWELFERWTNLEDLESKHYYENKTLAKDTNPRHVYVRRPMSHFITTRDWYKWGWRYDPTIKSMLKVIDTIIELFPIVGIEYAEEKLKTYYERLNKITFDQRNLDDLKQGDELYIKMNARGKDLSEFDKLKSSLEEEMQLQGASVEIESTWRAKMDGLWLDYFWNRIKGDLELTFDKENNKAKKTLSVVKSAESSMMVLLLRFIAIQYYGLDEREFGDYFEKNNYRSGVDNLKIFVDTCFSSSDDNNWRSLFQQYADLMWWMRKNKINFPVVNFQQIINDFDNLLYKDGDTWNDITHIGIQVWDRSNSSDYLNNISSYPHQVMFYSLVAFVRKYKGEVIAKDVSLKEDFRYWVRFIRNISYLNNSPARIDDKSDVRKAKEVIDLWMEEYSAGRNTGNVKSMCEYISKLDSSKTFFTDTLRVKEEIIKAQLRLSDSEWDNSFEKYENSDFFNGQIGEALMSWCLDDGVRNKELFKDYTERLMALVRCAETDIHLVHQALLCIRDYREKETFKDCLGRFYYDKARSIKHYLRQKNYSCIYRDLLSLWRTQYANYTNFRDFSNKLINDTKLDDWRKWVLERPDILDYGYWQVVVTEDVTFKDENLGAYTFLTMGKTNDSSMVEVFLYYLKKSMEDKGEHCDLNDYRLMKNGLVRHELIILKSQESEKFTIGLAGESLYYLNNRILSDEDVLNELLNK